MRRSLRALLITVSAAAAMAATSPAAGAVSYVDVSCESGGRQYFCIAGNDASAPATVKWYINGSYVASLDDRTSTGQRSCQAGTVVNVQVVVTDATGSLTGAGGVHCNTGPWP